MAMQGVIHGDTVKLDHPAEVSDGRRVVVSLQHAKTLDPIEQRARLYRLFGCLSDEAADVDEFMCQVRRDRDAWGGRSDPSAGKRGDEE